MSLDWYTQKGINRGRPFISVSNNYLRLSYSAKSLLEENNYVDLAIDSIGRLAISPMVSPRGRFRVLKLQNGRAISCYLFIRDTELKFKKYYYEETLEVDGRKVIFMRGE